MHSRSRPWLFLLAISAATPVAAEPPKDAKTVDEAPYEKAFKDAVNSAIKRGSAFVKNALGKDGLKASTLLKDWPSGPTALGALTLLHCGIPATDSTVLGAMRYLRLREPKRTYETAIELMAIASQYDAVLDPFQAEMLDKAGKRVIHGIRPEDIPEADKERIRLLAKFLVDHQVKPGAKGGDPNGEADFETIGSSGGWSYPPDDPKGGGKASRETDLSNTQYALLGLKAASRCGADIPLETWSFALRGLMHLQVSRGPSVVLQANEVQGGQRTEWTEPAESRGFPYTGKTRGACGTMTCAGAAGLMICLSELWDKPSFSPEIHDVARKCVRDAFAWMQQNYSAERSAGPTLLAKEYPYYYHYGLERMGTLGHLRFIGGHDWYEEGAKVLMKAQQGDGGWEKANLIESCFAILFLRRATVRVPNSIVTPSDPTPSDNGAAMGDDPLEPKAPPEPKAPTDPKPPAGK